MTRLFLVIALAASAGIHSALAAEHGESFLLAAGLLALAATFVSLRPDRRAFVGAALLLAALLASYAAEHGLAVEGIAAATKAVEAAGLVLAVRLARRTTSVRPERVATFVAAAMVAVLAAAATPSLADEHPAETPAHGH